MIDNRSPYLNIPLPDPNNNLSDDAPRLRDAINQIDAALVESLCAGLPIGWSMAPSGGTADEPAQILWSNGLIQVKAVLTWVNGDVTSADYSKTVNGGTSWAPIGVQNVAYDVDGNVTGVSWV